jgi:hypothetical protein
MQIPDVISKLLDNANVGKFVTDVGAGLALAVSLLMIFGLSTGITVAPLSTADELRQQQAAQRQLELEGEKAFCKEPNATEALAHRCYLEGVRRIARLNASIEAIRQQIAADQRGNKTSAPTLIKSQEELQSESDDLSVRQAVVEERAAVLATLNNQFSDANSFAFNARTIGENISALLALSVILGVIVSQVSRYVFIDNIFDRALKPPPTPLVVVADKEYDDLRTNYLRYVEGAINMIPPILLFGFVFPKFSAIELQQDVSAVTWGGAAVVISIVLGLVAFNTYKSYVNKLRDISLRFQPAPVGAGRP